MVSFFGFGTTNRYEKFLKLYYTKKSVNDELNSVFELYKKKIDIERRIISVQYTREDIADLLDILSELEKRFATYTKFYRIINKMSKKFANQKNHSSHIIKGDIERIQSIAKVSFEEILEQINNSKSLLDKDQISQYLNYQKSIIHFT